MPNKPELRAPWFNRVSPGYFETMGTPMLEGRDFNDRDTMSSLEVAIVSKKFQEKYLNGADPIGKQFRIRSGPGEKQHSYQIVGLVKDSKYQSLSSTLEPLVFLASTQDPAGLGTNLIIQSHEPIGPLTANVKNAILGENASVEMVFQVFKTQVQESLLRERLMATLSGFFGILAALLASVGLYGVISYMVARRKNEIGIRVACGANRIDIVRLVFREAGVLLGVGMAIGIALTLGGLRLTQALLYGLQASDPVTIVLAVALLASVSLLASWVPAYRASRLDPVQALREE
jgi:predicted permease